MNGVVSTTIVAGPIRDTGKSVVGFGQQLSMADTSVMLYITPEVAQQWLPVIAQIAGEKGADTP